MIIIRSKTEQRELEETITAILRQEHIEAEYFSFSFHRCFSFADLTIDGRQQQVFKNGKEILLTNNEFNLLLFFACNSETVLSKEELFCAVWGKESEDTLKVVSNTISNLRKKISADGSAYIHTVRGGYIFSASQDDLQN